MYPDKLRYLASGRDIRPGITATLAMFVLLFWVTFAPQLFLGTGSGSDGGPSRPLGMFSALALLVLALPAQNIAASFKLPPASMLAAIAWCWLSVVWAIAPEISLRRVILTTIVIALIFLLVEQLRYERSVDLMKRFFLIVLICSFVTVLAFPSVGISHLLSGIDEGETGQWKGIFIHKNITGPFCAITAFLFIFDKKGFGLPTRFIIVLASVFFLYMTKSKTSLAIFMLACVIGFSFQYYRPARQWVAVRLFVLCAAIVLFFLWFAFGQQYFSEVMADPTGFTGRTVIWRTMLPYIEKNWVLGSGFSSFWSIGGASPALNYQDPYYSWAALVGQGHNGFLDILTQIGVPGLLLVMNAAFIVPIWRLLRYDVAEPERRAMLIAMIVFILGNNVMESTLFERDSFLQATLMFVAAWAHQLTKQPKVFAGVPLLAEARETNVNYLANRQVGPG